MLMTEVLPLRFISSCAKIKLDVIDERILVLLPRESSNQVTCYVFMSTLTCIITDGMLQQDRAPVRNNYHRHRQKSD